MSRIVGDAGWANFSAGQSIGILGMVAILFGWGVIGPVRVARARDKSSRVAILRESLRSRLLLSLVAIPVVAIVTWIVCTDAYRVESVAVAVAMATAGLSPAWYCIGEGNPRGVMLYDALPKLTASAVAFPILALSGQVLWYPIVLAIVTLPSFAAHAWKTLKRHPVPHEAPRALRHVMRSLLPTAAIDATGNAYGSTAIPIATAGLEPTDASAFASADRAYRIGTLAVVAVANAFQAWVLEPVPGNPRRRHLAALGVHATLALLGGVAIAVLGPWATGLVFGTDVAARPVPSLLFGVAFFAICLATPLIRNLLVPAGRYKTVLAATICAAAAGVSVMLFGSWIGSEVVVAAGVATSEIVALAVLALPALSEFRRLPRALA
ncbi:polysaccharide biosynthesis protein [Microbacterium aurantiacum]|uniref:Polysaccharide biosynthesis protein n=1 Tax=Microbacterium aurantiacum TaxID=162393 RepID=A0AAJ2HGC5_9MICO|nr:polysaccharide biosynthesis protein [Microbacterium aurantiacum]MDS0243995.1 polysaccharide biosynthesis protein [Microbacterium aurantiacum]